MCYWCAWVKNFTVFQSTTSHVWVTGHFEQSALNDPKMTLKPPRSKVPHIFVTSIHELLLVSTSHFSVTGHFETSAPNDSKMTLNTTSSNVPHMCYLCPWFPNFTQFCSTAIRFWDIRHFETSAPNDPKMTLNTIRSNVPHICIYAYYYPWV